MNSPSLVAMSDALIDAAGAGGKPAVLIAQFDIYRDEHVFRWSCEDRSVGFRRGDTGEMSRRELDEVMRTWRESELAPGSTVETAEEAKQFGPGTSVTWANFQAA